MATSTKLHKLKISRSNDFTLGAVAPPRRDRGDSATEIRRHRRYFGWMLHEWLTVETDEGKIKRLQSRFDRLDWERRLELFEAYESKLESHLISGETEKAALLQSFMEKIVAGLNDSPPSEVDTSMGLSDATISHTNGQQESLIENAPENQGFQRRAKRGSKGISAAAKRKIKSCGVILEERFRRANLVFGTCTTPPVDETQQRLLCENWSEIVRQFFQALTRLLVRKNLSTDYVQVTEIQEKRFEKWGQVCPHLHFVFQGRSHSREPWRLAPADIQFLWQRTLENVLGVRLDCRSATRIENPRKSLSKELGKYLTKGGKVVREILDRGLGDYLPSSWYGASKSLSALERAARIERTGEIATYVLRHLEALAEAKEIKFRRIYARFKCPQTGVEREICVGASGWFTSREAVNRVLDMQFPTVRAVA